MHRSSHRLAVVLCAVAAVTACAFALQKTTSTPATTKASRSTVVLNITSGPDEVFRLLTAFHVAEDAVADGRHVVLFFNGRGVTVPLKRLSDELQLGRERTLWRVLQDLVQCGTEVLVARESVRALNLSDDEFIVETQFGQWGGSVFCKMEPGSVVFSY